MGIWLCIRSQLRSRWAAWTVVALLIGLAGGVVLATAAGARRTASAYPRFLRETKAADVLVSPNNTGFPGYYEALQNVPGAAAIAPVVGVGAAPVADPTDPVLVQAATNASLGRDVEGAKLLAGRLPRPDHADEVLADALAARHFHLHVGSEFPVVLATREQELPDPSSGPHVNLRVVGIGVTRDNVLPANALASQPTLVAGPALLATLGQGEAQWSQYSAFDGALVRLAPGTDGTAFTDAAQALAGRFPATSGVFVADEGEQAQKVEHAIRPEAVALALFAVLAAIVGVFAVGQLLVRQVVIASDDALTWRSLGLTGRQRFVVVVIPVLASAIVGAVTAVVIAVAASRWMPIGPARVAEPHPGVAFDAVVLGPGALAIVAVALLIVAWPAWRAVGSEAGSFDLVVPSRHRLRVEEWASRAGAPSSVAVAIGHTTAGGRQRGALPTRSAIAGLTVAIAAVAGALTFGVNLSHFVATPHLYGQTWDVTADAQFSVLDETAVAKLLRDEPGVTDWTFGEHGDISVDGEPVPAIGLDEHATARLAPTLLDGSAPLADDEIVLGAKTLAGVRGHLGQTVDVNLDPTGGSQTSNQMRVVGRGVFPFFGRGSFTPAGLGVGALVLSPKPGSLNPEQQPGFNFVLIDVAPGARHGAEVQQVMHDLAQRELCGNANQCAVTNASRPIDVLNYARVQSTPIALAAMLAGLGALVLAYVLLTSLRLRRRDFAVLKTLGFTPRQVSSTIVWNATVLVLLALLVGVPIGVIAGRSAWGIFATNLGVPANPATPVTALILAAAIALVIANLTAAAPAVREARRAPAPALRTD